MWRWLSILALAIEILPAAAAPGTPADAPVASSRGGTSRIEAEVLWREAKALVQNGDFESAIFRLERLINRYPGTEHYLDAHLYLGRAWLGVGKPAKALEPFKAYAASAGDGADGIRGKLWLGETRLRLKQADEAYLLAQEIQKKLERRVGSDPALLAETLLLKTRALIGTGDDSRARQALDSARKLIFAGHESETAQAPPPEAKLAGGAHQLEMELKTRECSRLPSAGAGDEAQVRAQMDRRGICLLEALVSFRNAVEAGDSTSAKTAQAGIIGAFEDFHRACRKPYSPSKTVKRTAREIKQYQLELRELLEQECDRRISAAQELSKTWPGKPEFQALNRTLQKLRES